MGTVSGSARACLRVARRVRNVGWAGLSHSFASADVDANDAGDSNRTLFPSPSPRPDPAGSSSRFRFRAVSPPATASSTSTSTTESSRRARFA